MLLVGDSKEDNSGKSISHFTADLGTEVAGWLLRGHGVHRACTQTKAGRWILPELRQVPGNFLPLQYCPLYWFPVSNSPSSPVWGKKKMEGSTNRTLLFLFNGIFFFNWLKFTFSRILFRELKESDLWRKFLDVISNRLIIL